jgi:carbon-monoxide dehydrogenase small subunit
MRLSFTLNGAPVTLDTAPDRRVLDLLREDLPAGALPSEHDSPPDTLPGDPVCAASATPAPDQATPRPAAPAACAADVSAQNAAAAPALDVKEGCGTGECGACSILVDGVHKLACLMLAAQLEGCVVVTAAGLGTREQPHAIQTAFAGHGAVQCGFCTPGMEIAAAALLAENPAPTREDIRRGLSGNLCRCTGYVKIVDAVEAAAVALREEGATGKAPAFCPVGRSDSLAPPPSDGGAAGRLPAPRTGRPRAAAAGKAATPQKLSPGRAKRPQGGEGAE